MNRKLSSLTIGSLGFVLFGGNIAVAQLVDGNVLLLWNSFDVDKSLPIKQAYVAAHPGVVTFDLQIDYALYPPNSVINSASGCSGNCDNDCPTNHECMCCACPTFALGIHGPQQPFLAIDQYHVTSAMYETHIRQPIVDFLADYAASHPEDLGHEPILAIVTTRGLPAVVTESFDAAIRSTRRSPLAIYSKPAAGACISTAAMRSSTALTSRRARGAAQVRRASRGSTTCGRNSCM